jgi:hypothetical protein
VERLGIHFNSDRTELLLGLGFAIKNAIFESRLSVVRLLDLVIRYIALVRTV